MIPTGGITALLCLLIIVIKFVFNTARGLFDFRVFPKSKMPGSFLTHAVSILIVVFTSVIVFVTVSFIFYLGIHRYGNNMYYERYFASEACSLNKILHKDKMVVIRLDDVQAHSLSVVAMRIMQDTFDRGYPVVAGVIPDGIDEDTVLAHFLRHNKCRLQVAMHGDTHIESEYSSGVGEFAQISEDEAISKLRHARKELAGITQYEIKTFIPPQNMLSIGARNALKKESFNIISSHDEGQYDIDTGTYEFETRSFIQPETTINECLNTFDKGDDLCVVMVHPQDFSNNDGVLNNERYSRYLLLLDYFDIIDASIVTFDEYFLTQHK